MGRAMSISILLGMSLLLGILLLWRSPVTDGERLQTEPAIPIPAQRVGKTSDGVADRIPRLGTGRAPASGSTSEPKASAAVPQSARLDFLQSLAAARAPLSQSGWELLRARASQGDPQSAFELALRLGTCLSLETTLDLTLARSRSDDADHARTEQELRELEVDVRSCVGVETNHAEAVEAFLLAVRLGHPDAIRAWFSTPAFGPVGPEGLSSARALGLAEEILEYKRESMAMMLQLAHSGHSGALSDLGFSYQYGYRAEAAPARAVAYFRAADRRPDPSAFVYGNMASYWEAQLDPAQRAEADRIERELERAIASCCK